VGARVGEDGRPGIKGDLLIGGDRTRGRGVSQIDPLRSLDAPLIYPLRLLHRLIPSVQRSVTKTSNIVHRTGSRDCFMTIRSEELRELYAGLLTEMRARRVLINELLNKKEANEPNLLPDFAAIELCYLQLRMLCELIALACLAAYGDIPASRTSKLLREYKADWIIQNLERLHPDFYPIPVIQLPYPQGSAIAGEIRDYTGVYLTKEDLIKLYYECGRKLHRGPTRKLKPLSSFNFTKIRAWHDKILALLKSHRIRLIDERHELCGSLNVNNTGRGQAALMQRKD
jgi:hypothetical protein